jgi:hypothetical protein
LQRLRQDDVVEPVGGIVDQIGVRIALNHGKTLSDAFIDARLRKLEATSVRGALIAQQPEQLAVAATDVENPRSAIDHASDHEKIDAIFSHEIGHRPRAPIE